MGRLLNAGKYRHQITITNPPSSRDSLGGAYGTGSTVATVWAEKQDWSGSETLENGQDAASVQTKFIIRYRTDIFPKMLVINGTDTYDIESVLDFDGLVRELILQCRKVMQ